MAKKSKKARRQARVRRKAASIPANKRRLDHRSVSAKPSDRRSLRSVVVPTLTTLVTSVGYDIATGVASDSIRSALGLGFKVAPHSVAPSDDNTIDYSRQWVSEHRDHGVRCPTCDRVVKRNHLLMNRSMATVLQRMYEAHGTNWCNPRDLRTKDDSELADKNHVTSKMAQWLLVRQHPDSKRKGNWGITWQGEQWLEGKTTIPLEVVLDNGELVSQSEQRISFAEVMEKTEGLELSRRKLAHRTYESAPSSDRMFRDKYLKIQKPTENSGDKDDFDLFDELDSQEVPTAINEAEHYQGEPFIGNAKEWLYDNLKAGVYCPTCDRHAMYKKYPINDVLARLMIEIYKRRETVSPIQPSTFTINKRVVDRAQQASTLERRGLLRRVPAPEGEIGSGWYVITPEGENWVRNESTTPSHISSYNRYAKTFDEVGDGGVTIREVLATSKNWSYETLMKGHYDEDALFPITC